MSDKLPPQILVLETDELLRASLCNAIERYWFTVIRASDADSAMRLLRVNRPNVMVVGTSNTTMLIEICSHVRKIQGCAELPIVILMNPGDTKDTYKAINLTLVEFVQKPLASNEVLTSIKSLIRKSKPVFRDKIIRYKDISMDLATYKVYRETKAIHLGPTEFKILQLLMQSPKTIFSRQQVIDYVWGTDMNIEPRTVDVHVNRIRALIKQHKDEMPFIKTVRASGYCLNLPGEVD